MLVVSGTALRCRDLDRSHGGTERIDAGVVRMGGVAAEAAVARGHAVARWQGNAGPGKIAVQADPNPLRKRHPDHSAAILKRCLTAPIIS